MPPPTIQSAPITQSRLVKIEGSVLATPNPKDAPPSFLMQPVDMGCDMYEPAANPNDSPSGLQRRAPYQFGDWALSPVYNHTLQCLVDTVSSTVWTRAGHPAIAAGWTPDTVKKAISALRVPPELRWLHCLRIAPSNDLRIASFLVMDYVHPTHIHAARRALLTQYFPELGIRERADPGVFHLVPEVPHTHGIDLWYALHLMNKEWNHDCYTGIVARQANARYYMQKEDFNIQTLRWQLHKFTAPIPE